MITKPATIVPPGQPVAWGYGRISKDDKTQVHSRDSQQSLIQEVFAREYAGPYVFGGLFFDEDISGGTNWFERPQGRLLFDRVRQGDLIIVRDAQRAWRNLGDGCACLDYLRHSGISVRLLDLNVDTNNPIGRLVVEILIAVSAWERNMTSQRNRWAVQVKKDKGLPYNGSSPLGWELIRNRVNQQGVQKGTCRYEPCPCERATAARVVALRDQHGFSFERIRQLLRAEGHRRQPHRLRTLPKHWRFGQGTPELYGLSGVQDLYYASKLGFPLKNMREIAELARAQGLMRAPRRPRAE